VPAATKQQVGTDECAAFMLWRAAVYCAWDSGRCCPLHLGLALLHILYIGPETQVSLGLP
jgi:hypothetical protein